MINITTIFYSISIPSDATDANIRENSYNTNINTLNNKKHTN